MLHYSSRCGDLNQEKWQKHPFATHHEPWWKHPGTEVSLPCHIFPALDSRTGTLEGSLVQECLIKALYQGVLCCSVLLCQTPLVACLGHWRTEGSILLVPWQGVPNISTFTLGTSGKTSWRASGLPGYLLLEERTWCLIQVVGADETNKMRSCVWLNCQQFECFTLTAWLSRLPRVAGTAAKGRLEVMDRLLKDLPLSALVTSRQYRYKSCNAILSHWN